MDNQHQQVMQALHDCMAACNYCYDACLQEDHSNHMSECIRLDRECADMCNYLESAIARNSPFIQELAVVCAKICEACGEECKQHDMDHCQQCADACFQCANACRQLV